MQNIAIKLRCVHMVCSIFENESVLPMYGIVSKLLEIKLKIEPFK